MNRCTKMLTGSVIAVLVSMGAAGGAFAVQIEDDSFLNATKAEASIPAELQIYNEISELPANEARAVLAAGIDAYQQINGESEYPSSLSSMKRLLMAFYTGANGHFPDGRDGSLSNIAKEVIREGLLSTGEIDQLVFDAPNYLKTGIDALY